MRPNRFGSCWVRALDAVPTAARIAAQIVVEESDGHTNTLDATEIKDGVYQATMTDAGETHAEIALPAAGGGEVEADFYFHVSETH